LERARPLDDICVVDLSRLLPGPMCSWYLRGLGARVVRIEAPDSADFLRHMPPVDSNGVGVWFSALHAGKESVALNLKLPVHREAFLALLSKADVLIESFRPGVMARLGLDPADLRERFPSLVICSITGFGQQGPLRDRPGHDLGFQALSGALSMAPQRGGVADVPSVQVADVGGGALTGALRIVAALMHRLRTGKGEWLDVSMTDGTLAMLAPHLAGAAAAGRDPEPGGEALSGGSPQYQIYQCRDGKMLAVAPLEPKFWAALQEAVGREIQPDKDSLSELFAEADRDVWAERLGEACCEPVLTFSEVGSHPHFTERGVVSGSGRNQRVSHPFEGGAETATLPAPLLGQHTAEALRRVGFDPDRLEDQS